MELNFATTVSFCAAATAVSYGALGAYLARSPESRRFRWAGIAGLAAATYCLTNAILAGRPASWLAVWADAQPKRFTPFFTTGARTVTPRARAS